MRNNSMNDEKRMEKVSWQQVDDAAQKIADWARKHNLSGVFGPPKGGMILAILVSNRLGVKFFSYLPPTASGFLIVDDIADTGNALIAYSKNFKNKLATIYYHKESKVRPNFYVKEKGENWIHFPWEVDRSAH